jgi:DNA-binding phage protein
MTNNVPFKTFLNEYLQDSETAISYLKSALEENDPELFNAALKSVVDAQKGTPIALSQLVDSLHRHGIREETIQAVIMDISALADAA